MLAVDQAVDNKIIAKGEMIKVLICFLKSLLAFSLYIYLISIENMRMDMLST